MLETNSKVYLSYACIDKILYGLGKSTDKSLNEVSIKNQASMTIIQSNNFYFYFAERSRT